MADNVTLNSGTGGAVAATDDVGGVHFQKVKIDVGGDGVSAALSNSNPLPISDAGGSITVDGTVELGATALAALETITVASVTAPLAAGTNNIGDVDVLSVVPGTGATALGKAVDSVAGATDTGVAALFVRDDTLAALTPADGDYVPARVDSTGALHVRVSAGGISGIADDAAFTAGTSELVPVGFLADEASTDSVDENDLGAARMTLDRKQIVTPYAHAAAGGATPYFNLDCDETEDDIKTSAGKIFWLHAINLAATKRYLKFYNDTAANVVVGTATPVLSLPIPTMADTNGAGFTINFGAMGVQFTTAICVAATTGFANNDTGAPGANEVIINLGYL